MSGALLRNGLIVCLVLVLSCYAIPQQPTNKINLRPIIGVFEQPTGRDSSDCQIARFGHKYIPASYIKFIESTGARVVPIPYDSPNDVLLRLFNSINGFLIPGGSANFTPGKSKFYDSALYMLNLAMQANDRGDYFPVFGICQGMQMISVMLAGSNCSVLDFDYNSENLSLPLNFTSSAPSSLLWGTAPDWVVPSISTKNITFNNHKDGVPPSKYQSTTLSQYVTVLSTNVDLNNKEFVSSFEGIKYPIWGLQFHPSKLAYEWNPNEVLNHEPIALANMQWVGDFMFSQAKYNTHSFASAQEEQDSLIYNYPPVYTYPTCNEFEQCYFFNHTSSSIFYAPPPK